MTSFAYLANVDNKHLVERTFTPTKSFTRNNSNVRSTQLRHHGPRNNAPVLARAIVHLPRAEYVLPSQPTLDNRDKQRQQQQRHRAPHYTQSQLTQTNPRLPVVSLVAGWHAASSDPSAFVSRHLPSTPTSALTPASATVLSYTLSNIFLLLGGLAILCTVITRDANVTKWYLGMVALGDLGHIYSSYAVMGPQVFWDFGAYNDLMWGNIGASAFLHVNRVATLLGVFGRVGRR
jgi:hypothetical protein